MLAATAWGVFRAPSTPTFGAPRHFAPVEQPPGLPSHTLKKLMPGPLMPAEPLYLVVSPVPATLTDGVPPT